MTINQKLFNEWQKDEETDGYVKFVQFTNEDRPEFKVFNKILCAPIVITKNELEKYGWNSHKDVSEKFIALKYRNAILSMRNALDHNVEKYGLEAKNWTKEEING